MKRIAIGTDDFRKIRMGHNLYVDKTLLIREVLDGGEALLLPRPRRFGKTLNMTMLQTFFDHKQDSRALFEGLAITGDAEAMTHLNAYPTIFITFKELNCLDWDVCLDKLVRLVADMIHRHSSLEALAKLSPSQQADLKDASLLRAPLASLASLLKTLTELLFLATGKKVVVLIDEYDTPIHAGHSNGYYPQIISFLRGFLGEGLKGNPYLERAVITGILRVGKESIYSGLNNLSVHSMLSPKFSTCFGFTESEVAQLLVDAQSPHPLAEVQAWYNGYRFGQEIIYNPWSILSMLDAEGFPLGVYWVNTSTNDLIADLIKQRSALQVKDLDALLRGETQNHKIQEALAIGEIDRNSVWGLLLFSGYLTAESWNPTTKTAALRLPNLEVRSFFEETVESWLGSDDQVQLLVDALLDLNLEVFAQGLSDCVKTILSFHDVGGPHQEKTYHVLMVGLLASLHSRYEVLSNRESGHGRYDLALMPRKQGQPGFIFEFKKANAKNLAQKAKEGLDQILGADYAGTMRQAGVTTIASIGLAFSGKRVALASSIWESSSDQSSDSAGSKEAKTEPQQTADLVAQIQALQKAKGKAVTPKSTLLNMEQAALEALADALTP